MSGKIIEFPSRRDTNRASLQIARISALLEELEDLIGDADDRSSPDLLQARSIVELARRMLTPHTDNDGDPQPDVDRSLLERMYRDLNPIA